MAKYRGTVKDASNENSRVSFNVADAITDADLTTLYNALGGVIIGTRSTFFLVTEAQKDAGSQALPADQFAQRETKWLASYTDDVTGTLHRLELPCADLDIAVGGTQLANLETGAGATFKAAWDASILSPAGNASTLNSMRHVGRNL
jgi:hypothetical protein